MSDYKGPERRRFDLPDRVTRLETVVERVAEDVHQTVEALREKNKADNERFASIYETINNDRGAVRELSIHVKTIADAVKDQSLVISKHGKVIVYVTGVCFGVVTAVGSVYAILKLIVPFFK